ncbi:MAG: BamA/TamA family outer membrane protein [Longimicrobiales bacterium]|nr:BamA/TamA family outer membrane protein [Longimicrobiales bacterium]
MGFVRGYSFGSFDGNECTDVAGEPQACPEFDRLVGTRIAVANAEIRIPLLGTEWLGLIALDFLPTELSLFGDAGLAWTSEDAPELDVATHSTERIPVFSAGASLRFNLFGRLVAEVFYAMPFQRPERTGVWGFQLSPGW